MPERRTVAIQRPPQGQLALRPLRLEGTVVVAIRHAL